MSFSSKAAAVGGIGAIFALVLRERKESRNGKRRPTTFGWDGGSWSVGQSRLNNEGSGQLAVKGIKNLGNTCFLNAVLQSLGSFPVFREYLEDLQALSRQPLDKNRTPEGDSPFTFELLNLMNDLRPWVPPTPPLVPVDATKLRKLLSKEVGAFGEEDQQDAQELFQMVMRLLGEEAALCLQRHKGVSEIGGTAGLQGLITSTPKARHVPENPLRGTLTHLRHCRGCREKSIRSSPFVDLSLTLPEARNHLLVGPVNLEKVLEDFTQEQLVEDVECPTCAMRSAMDEDQEEEEEMVVPPKRVPADMRMLLASLPKTLCLHFPRRHQSPSGSEMKLQQRVVFPLHLNVAPFCCTGGSHTDSIGMSTALQMKNKIASSLTQLTPGRTAKALPGAPAPSPAAKAIQSPKTHHVGKQPLVGGNADGASAVASRKERYGSSSSGGARINGSGGGIADGHNSIDASVSNNGGVMDYDLRAVIVHQGGADSGHYTAFRKLESNVEEAVEAPNGPKVVNRPPGGKPEGGGCGKEEWVYISDEDVERGVSESRVLSSQAYMLFYRQRITEVFNRGVS